MKITRENYESFFLDYLEGNLDEQLIDEFLEFLQQNPDLKSELQGFEKISLPEDLSEFPGKERLFRHNLDQPEIFENHAIGMMEGDLSTAEAQEFMDYIGSRTLAAGEYERFRKTRLIPDESVIFAQKDKLYHQPSIRPMIFMAMRVAAVLLVAVTIWSIWPDDTREILNQPVISEVLPVPDKPAGNAISEENTQLPGTENLTAADKSETVVPSEAVPGSKTEKSTNLIKSESGRPENLMADNRVPVARETQGNDSRSAGIAENIRLNIEIPDALPARKVALERTVTEPLLAAVTPSDISVPEESGNDDDLYLTDRIRQRIGADDFSFSKLVRSGIDLASNLSGEKVSYATNDDGEIVALSLNTRLLGLRIPVGKK
jgi:hypothetical protein